MTDQGSGRQDRHVAKKSLGQNFLIDPNLQRKIVGALHPAPDDEVLEIGPGLGALTRHLVGRVGRLVLVELDDGLADRLEREFGDDQAVHLVRGDILDADLTEILENPARAKVIGNIPYNITTPIIFHLIEKRPRPAQIVLMVQKEVADRILAAPGSKTYGALAVGIQAVADVQRVLQVSRNAFKPAPDVDSTVIRIVPRVPPALAPDEEVELRILTRFAFGQRRKQFQRILRDAYAMTEADIREVELRSGFDLRGRPEIFSAEDFITLSRTLSAFRRPTSEERPLYPADLG